MHGITVRAARKVRQGKITLQEAKDLKVVDDTRQALLSRRR